MGKTHSTPEFTVIKQSQANAKFFVASGEASDFTGESSSTGGPAYSASQYNEGGDFNL